MRESYFEGVERIGNLYLEKVFMKFEDENILFICTDDNNQRYLGVCYETRMALKWVLCKVSNEAILQMLFGVITVRECFEGEAEVLLINYTETDGETAEWKMIEDVNSRILPDADFYVKYDMNEDNYYLNICKQMFLQSKSENTVHSKANECEYQYPDGVTRAYGKDKGKVTFRRSRVVERGYNNGYVMNRQYA